MEKRISQTRTAVKGELEIEAESFAVVLYHLTTRGVIRFVEIESVEPESTLSGGDPLKLTARQIIESSK